MWTVSVNGTTIKPEEGKWWLDSIICCFQDRRTGQTRDTQITLKTYPMKIHAEVEPVISQVISRLNLLRKDG